MNQGHQVEIFDLHDHLTSAAVEGLCNSLRRNEVTPPAELAAGADHVDECTRCAARVYTLWARLERGSPPDPELHTLFNVPI